MSAGSMADSLTHLREGAYLPKMGWIGDSVFQSTHSVHEQLDLCDELRKYCLVPPLL